MNYKSLNNQELEKLLDFYKLLDEKLKWIWIVNILYGSLSYLYFTFDENIVVGDIDLIAPEWDFQKIIEIMKNEKDVICEVTNYNSLKLFKNWAKLSIHSQEIALNIADFKDNLADIEINWVKFKSLWLDDLLKFYKKCNDKIWYKEKFKNLIKTRYWEDYTFFLLKPSILERWNSEEIKNYIIKDWFEIINEKEIFLTSDDVSYIYEEDYNKLIPILWEKNVKKAIENSHKLYDNKKIVLILAKSTSSIEKADFLKWDNYLPKKCRENSIRYIFRDKEFDYFDIPKWEIIETPFDNIVHCPKTFDEFYNVFIKWLI